MKSLVPRPTARQIARRNRSRGVTCFFAGVVIFGVGIRGGSLLLLCVGVVLVECAAGFLMYSR